MVEFSLVLPILLCTTIGLYDAGRMVTSKTMLAYAVTVGARTATAKVNSSGTTLSTSDVQQVVINAAPFLNLSTSNVTTVSSSNGTWASRTRGNSVTVTATYTFTPLLPFLTKLAAKTYTYTSTMTIP